MPRDVIDRAKVILHNLEAQTLDAENKPKFARSERPGGGPKAQRPAQIQLTLFGRDDRLAARLKALDLSRMTPLEALQVLEDLQREAGG